MVRSEGSLNQHIKLKHNAFYIQMQQEEIDKGAAIQSDNHGSESDHSSEHSESESEEPEEDPAGPKSKQQNGAEAKAANNSTNVLKF